MRLLSFVCIMLLCAGCDKSLEIHLSPNGSDSNTGDKSSPLKTLEKARDVAREIREAHTNAPIAIMMHPGIYEINKTVVFSKQDSGSPDNPLQIRGVVDNSDPDAQPQLAGGIVVDNWKKCTFNGRSDVFEADLKPLGIKKKFRQLFLNGTRQIWARYPNYNPDLPYSGGWAYVHGERPPMYTDIEGERTDTVVLREKDMRSWSRPADGEVCIFPRYNWWNKIVPIKSFDVSTRTITLTKKMPYAARPEDRYAVFGMKEELDAPGEWYQDVEGQKLYFIPPCDLKDQVVTVPVVDAILKFESVSNAVLSGLEFSCAERQSVYLHDCRNVSIEKSLVHDLGYMYGAGISIRKGYDCAVRGCDIWNVGGHGVEVYAGDKVKMDKCNHIVDNCYIHHVGQFNRHGLGIMVSGAGVTMSHNLMHDTPRSGIFHGGCLHTLEYNRIRHCNLEMEDTGATYGGGWTGGWSTIRYNHCADSIGFSNHGKFFTFCWGIYLDESGCAFDVYGNIVERCQAGAMHLHNARENHITNNIFLNNAGRDGKSRQFSMQGWTDSPKGKFLTDRQPKMLKAHNKLLENPEWKKMRGMHVSPADPFLPDGTMMRGNKVERNIICYVDQPDSEYIRAANVNFEYNSIDYNTVWNGGKVPVKTGKKGYKDIVADLSDKIPYASFPAVADLPEAQKTKLLKDKNQTPAQGWSWFHKTFPDVKAEVLSMDGKPSLKLYAAYNPDKKYIKNACVRSESVSFEPGKDYRLSFNLRMKEQDGPMYVRFVSTGGGGWRPFGSKSFNARDEDVHVCTTTFHLPGPGEKGYHEQLTKMSLHLQFNSKTGTAEISGLKLEEVVKATEWEAWRMLGPDQHSVVADPLFVDLSNGNFKLKSDSPALKLGFEQIPFEEIGLYKSDNRATWPVVEAEGVRENPQWLKDVLPNVASQR